MSQTEKPTAAFVLSLIAGIFILIDGVILGIVGSFIAGLDITGLISQYAPQTLGMSPKATVGLAVVSTVLYALMAVGVIFAAIVLLGALMLYRNPSQKTAWGVIILVLSIISIVTGGGFLIGFILGIIGGALALAWKPKTPTTAPATSATTTT